MITLVVTPGEPSGIGPEILIKAIQKPLAHLCDQPINLIAVADKQLLIERAKKLQLPLFIEDYSPHTIATYRPQHLTVIDTPLAEYSVLGQLNCNNVPYVLNTLDTAITLVNTNPHHALVTGPIHKGIINHAGIAFSGHTEYLAQKINLPHETIMMLTADEFRVALVTTHCPLSKVPELITPKRLLHTINTVHQSLIEQFHIQEPNILLSGLNPHAGEMGHLGREELDIIIPTLKQLPARLNLQGPFPADTLFTEKNIKQADAFITMYHDQGLSILKHKGFGKAVNITLGLPFIRTSVDHGVALDKAPYFNASEESLLAAINSASQLCLKSSLPTLKAS